MCVCVCGVCMHACMCVLYVVKRLAVCEELERSSCGSLLFYCQIKPPVFEQQHCEEDIHAQENSWHRLFSLHPTVLVKNGE